MELFDFLGYYRAWALALYSLSFYFIIKALSEICNIFEYIQYFFPKVKE